MLWLHLQERNIRASLSSGSSIPSRSGVGTPRTWRPAPRGSMPETKKVRPANNARCEIEGPHTCGDRRHWEIPNLKATVFRGNPSRPRPKDQPNFLLLLLWEESSLEIVVAVAAVGAGSLFVRMQDVLRLIRWRIRVSVDRMIRC